MEIPPPKLEHEWLQRLLGDWSFEAEMVMGPGQPPVKTKGRWVIRPVGALWIVADGEGTSPDGETHTSMMTIGFDPEKGRFVGTFIASPMTKLWLYDGAFDGQDRLILAASGPSFVSEGETLYHDIIEITEEGRFRFSSRLQGTDGAWIDFMSADYRRAA